MAFTGGPLALLSPCSALLLPSFFAYSFPSRQTLVARTLLFYAGLVTVLVPIGLGVGALGSLVLERRAELSLDRAPAHRDRGLPVRGRRLRAAGHESLAGAHQR